MITAPAKLIVLPSVFLGMIIGLGMKDHFVRGLKLEELIRAAQGLFFVIPFAIFLLFTVFVFLFRSGLAGLSAAQLRLLWILAFLLGVFGTPIIYNFANN